MANKLFYELKETFLREVEDLRPENIENKTAIFEKFLELLEVVSNESPLSEEGSGSEEDGNYPREEDYSDFYQDYPEDKEEEEAFEGSLSRQLKGGLISGYDIYVPERSIREFGFEEGDIIRAIPQGTKRIGNKFREFYFFECVQKAGEVQTDRRVASFAQVKRDDILGDYYIEALDGEGHPITVLLGQGDVDALHIDENERVDYAYWEDKILDGRVAWKYTLNGPVVDKPENLDQGEDGSLAGINLVVAVDDKENEAYEEEVARLGGNFISLDQVFMAFKENLPLDADYALVLHDKVPMTYFETLRKKLQFDDVPTVYIDQLEPTDIYGVLKENFHIED